ncbi:prenyltransferase [Paeniglutamicibacter antarcticus]|uniref:Prenyltransferase n=1 Tax=Arthrobacter terrae TaxID=2935737 RepID=A0A931G622_9MICC|nr:prenyltransferase [Arthrobacter terrae]MBG0740185.1 prenyltransferase [Arthrobacter terrae]
MTEQRTAPDRFRTLVVSSRPVSWVNTAYPFGAAYLLATGRLDLTAVVGIVYFLIPYNLAMYGINDVFDYESDLRNPRKGGIEGAVLGRGMHRTTLAAAAITNVPFLIYLFAVGNPLSAVVLVISVFAVLAYSAPRLRFKERPFLDSVTSSTHFVSPAVFGLTLADANWTPQLWCLLGAFFLWGVASHAFGAVQDISADKEAFISSIATVLGGKATVRLAASTYILAGLLMLGTTWPGPLAGILALPYAANAARYWFISEATAESANGGWKSFLWINFGTGFLVTLLLIWYSLV